MIVNKLCKSVKLNKLDNIVFQLTVHFYLQGINISRAGITVLALLAIGGKQNLKKFCYDISKKNNIETDVVLYSSEQSVRNLLDDFEKQNIVIKTGTKKKSVEINPNIQVITDGNILLDYKLFSYESN